MVCIGFSTIRSFRHPLEDLECIPVDKGGNYGKRTVGVILCLMFSNTSILMSLFLAVCSMREEDWSLLITD